VNGTKQKRPDITQINSGPEVFVRLALQ